MCPLCLRLLALYLLFIYVFNQPELGELVLLWTLTTLSRLAFHPSRYRVSPHAIGGMFLSQSLQDQGVLLNWYASLLALRCICDCHYLCWYQWYPDLQHLVYWNAQLPDGVLALPPSVPPDVPGVLRKEYAWEQSTLVTTDYISLAYLVCCLLDTVLPLADPARDWTLFPSLAVAAGGVLFLSKMGLASVQAEVLVMMVEIVEQSSASCLMKIWMIPYLLITLWWTFKENSTQLNLT